MKPYFSIILPIYNVAKYLPDCMQSILSQSFTDYEIILVDDGSPDISPALCDEYARKHGFVRVIHKPNGGLSSARNAGFEIARGQYVWWVDSDDWIEPDALAKLYAASCADLPDIVKFNHIRCSETRVENRSCVSAGFYASDAMDHIVDQAYLHAGKFSMSVWSHIYRTAFIRENDLQFISERIIGSEDYLFNLQALMKVRSMRMIDDALYNYELRVGSLSQVYKKDLFIRYLNLRERLVENCRESNKEKDFLPRINRFFIWHLVRGTCFNDEYTESPGHTIAEGRANVKGYLKDKCTCKALRCSDKRELNSKNRILLLAMKLRLEPLFYYLYVIKPRKGARNEA